MILQDLKTERKKQLDYFVPSGTSLKKTDAINEYKRKIKEDAALTHKFSFKGVP
jgi:hypothetical protein